MIQRNEDEAFEERKRWEDKMNKNMDERIKKVRKIKTMFENALGVSWADIMGLAS